VPAFCWQSDSAVIEASMPLLHHPRSWLAFAMVTAACIAEVRPALACRYVDCGSPVAVPSAATVPGNLVRFELLARAGDPAVLRMSTRDGQPIASRLRDVGGHRFLAPDEPIAEGTEVVVEYSPDCSLNAATVPVESFSFTASRHDELEAEIGDIYVAERGIFQPGVVDSERSFVRVRLPTYQTKGDDSYPDLIRYEATLDGAPYWVTLPDRASGTSDIEAVVSTRCVRADETRYDTCGELQDVPAGRHTLTITMSVLGEAAPSGVASIELDSSCSYAASSAAANEPTCGLSARTDSRSRLPLAAALLGLAGTGALRRLRGRLRTPA
jgi:hypothetical protein